MPISETYPIYETYGPTTTHIPYERPIQHNDGMSVTQHGDDGDKCDQTQHDEDEDKGDPTQYHNHGPNITTASEGQRWWIEPDEVSIVQRGQFECS